MIPIFIAHSYAAADHFYQYNRGYKQMNLPIDLKRRSGLSFFWSCGGGLRPDRGNRSNLGILNLTLRFMPQLQGSFNEMIHRCHVRQRHQSAVRTVSDLRRSRPSSAKSPHTGREPGPVLAI
jgi:hypothetical protein